MPDARLGDRTLFPTLEYRIYANFASVGPLPEPARRAASDTLMQVAARGAAAIADWLPAREDARREVEALIGAEPGTVGFVGNTTAGVHHVAVGSRWRAGDRIVVFGNEFPTNVLSWANAANRFGAELTTLGGSLADADGAAWEALEQELRRGVRLVAVSAVQFQSGHRVALGPLAALCHAWGAELFVDAIQAVGAVPLDVQATGVDWVAAGGHKWLMGGPGAGFLYGRPERVAALDPLLTGWLSVENPIDFLFAPGLLRFDKPVRPTMDRIEGSLAAFQAIASLGASVALLRSLGVASIHAHTQRWHDAVEPGLVALGFRSLRAAAPESRSGILSLEPPPGVTAPALAAGLAAFGVSVATPEGLVRLSPSWPNAIDEAGAVLAAVADVLEGTPPPPRPEPTGVPRLRWRSRWPERPTGWTREGPDGALVHPGYGAVHHVWVVGPDGAPRWDQPAWSEPVGAVTVPELPDGRLCFVRQYRPVAAAPGTEPRWPIGDLERAGCWSLELPRGFARPGEPPASAAAREAEEETGRVVRSVTRIGEANPNTTFFLHAIPVFRVVLGEAASTARPDADEHLTVVPLSRGEVRARIRDGTIGCGLTLAALACYEAAEEDP